MITGNLHEANLHFLSYPIRFFFIQWEIFQKKVVEKIKTRILCSIICFENRTFYEIMWKSVVRADRQQIIIWRMPIACWTPKLQTNTQYILNLLLFNEKFACTKTLQRTLTVLSPICWGCYVPSLQWDKAPPKNSLDKGTLFFSADSE